jgi:hypothetical protein
MINKRWHEHTKEEKEEKVDVVLKALRDTMLSEDTLDVYIRQENDINFWSVDHGIEIKCEILMYRRRKVDKK